MTVRILPSVIVLVLLLIVVVGRGGSGDGGGGGHVEWSHLIFYYHSSLLFY